MLPSTSVTINIETTDMNTRQLNMALVALIIVAGLLMTSGCATVPIRVEDRPARVEAPKSRVPYIAAYVVLTVMTVLDVETTHRKLDSCATCYEANPIMRPFVQQGRGTTYAVAFSLNAITMEIARRRRNENSRLWFVRPLIGAGIHGAAAASNNNINP